MPLCVVLHIYSASMFARDSTFVNNSAVADLLPAHTESDALAPSYATPDTSAVGMCLSIRCATNRSHCLFLILTRRLALRCAVGGAVLLSRPATLPFVVGSSLSALSADPTLVWRSGSYLHRCSFQGNSALWGGGVALLFFAGPLDLATCNFTANTARGKGGALFVRHATARGRLGCHFQDNAAPGGGAIGVESGTASFDHSNFVHNLCVVRMRSALECLLGFGSSGRGG
jgi:predicted outer membrane repeat protein